MKIDIPEGCAFYAMPKLGHGHILTKYPTVERYWTIQLFGYRLLLVRGQHNSARWWRYRFVRVDANGVGYKP